MSYALWCLALACAAAQPVETSTEATTHLYVRTTPSGAQILLDGKELGTSPGVFPVKPGQRRRLVIELDGQVAKEQQITIRDGRITRIELTLTPPKPAADSELPPDAKVESRSVGKKVSDFPEAVDLSTPESACAAFHRACHRLDAAAVADLSWGSTARGEKQFWAESSPEEVAIYNKARMEGKILEVLTYKKELAAVISRQTFPPNKGRYLYSLRGFGRIDGKWKSLGEERCPSLEAAAKLFSEKADRLWQSFQEERGTLAVDKPLSFGPVVERVVNDDDPKLGDFLIDFDTGQVLSPPVEQMKRAQQALEQWIVEAGVDAVGETKTSVRGLMGVDMIAIPISSNRWDRISPNDVAEAVDLGTPGRPIPISGKGELPATFIFQTREGGMGVLQILDFVEKPRGVKIRYKLVERRERKGDVVVLTFEVDRKSLPDAGAVDIGDLLSAIFRRLNRGWVGRVRVDRIGNQRIEVIVSTTDPEHVRRIERLVASPGTIEFRILANDRDHKDLIERALEKDDRRVLNPDGTLAAWWVPVAPGQEENSWKQQGIATRTIQEDGRQTLEILVVADPFDVTDAYLVEATSTVDSRGGPSVGFTFDSRGGQLLGGLTGANLPDKSGDFSRQLGIILNGQLHSAPSVRSTIRERGEITGDFTREEVEDLVDVLNAGPLPVPLEKLSEVRTSR
ncbi:MAG: PEGA domain-containing protein [Planctomycetes bacterium]|nr:PEGA domain-containing protein [Planctomycetota bacterium]